MIPERSISSIETVIATLPPGQQTLFNQLFAVQVSQVHLEIPQSMRSWLVAQFQSIDRVRQQQTVKITNRWTLDCTLFNSLRAQRPLQGNPAPPTSSPTSDPFAFPERLTPAAEFGRIQGKHVVTAANVAAYDSVHGVLIFHEPDPLAFTEDTIIDLIDVAGLWFSVAQQTQSEACFPILIWNCLPRAGASILHGHAQVILTSGQHYGGVERIRRAMADYRNAHGISYVRDLINVHQAIGLAMKGEVSDIIVTLTPSREKEILLISDAFDVSFAQDLFRLLSAYRSSLSVQAFNLAVYLPPLTSMDGWQDFPVMARLVDRGDPSSPVSDVAAMELFACSVVSEDPFRLASKLFE